MSPSAPRRHILPILLSCTLAFNRAPAQSPPATVSTDSSAQQLLSLANADRARFHLPPLAWSPTLTAAARVHAVRLLDQPTVEHQYPGEPDLLRRAARAGAQLSVISENLLRGDAALLTSAAGTSLIEQTWMTTPSHRANLLDPRLNAAGISLVRAGNTLAVVEDLARTSPAAIIPPGLQATGQTIAASLLAHGLTQAVSTAAAEDACRNPAPPGAVTPVLTIAWDGPDPTLLPTALLQQLPRHTRAEIATCPGAATAHGFATTRVVVLLP